MGEILQNADQLITAFKNNDQKVMQMVYQSTFPKFRNHVLKNSGNEAQAKDVFQDAFISLWRNIKEGKLESKSNVQAYLFTIAKNKWIDYLRSSNFKKTVSTESFLQLTVVADDHDTFDSKDVQIKVVRNAFTQLKEGCKSILQLFYFERRSMDEISKMMNLAPASARNQKYRCMEKLRSLSLQMKDNE